MFFLSNIFRAINFIIYNLFSPFRQVGYFFQRIRMMMRFGNPFVQLSRALGLYRIRGFFNRFRALFRSPTRLFRINLPPGFKNFFKRFGLFKSDGKGVEREATEGENQNYLYYRAKRRNTRWSTVEAEEFSQIHLIPQGTDHRTILHIGTSTRSSTVETILTTGDHRPVRLRFQQVNPDKFASQILMTHIAGQADVGGEGGNATRGIPIHHNTTFTIDKQVYTCELHANGTYEVPDATRITAGWFTSIGPRRTNNEDAIGIYQHRDAYLFLVADGVGGGEAGELISEFATRYLLAAFHKNIGRNVSWGDVMRRAVERINQEVWHFARKTPTVNKAGTTLTAVVIQKWDAFIVHVGDSRLYHWSNGTMEQITTDHIQHVAEQKTINPGQEPEAERTFLYKAIGRTEIIEPEIYTLRLQPRDRLLLCTDGVTGTIKDREISRDMGIMPPDELAQYLVETTNERHTTDNSSVIALEVMSHSFNWDTWRAKSADRVYTGYSGVYPLYVGREYEMPTQYQFFTGVKVTNIIFLIIALVILLQVLTAISDNDSPAMENASQSPPITEVTAEATEAQ